jgi:hypothetical protein
MVSLFSIARQFPKSGTVFSNGLARTATNIGIWGVCFSVFMGWPFAWKWLDKAIYQTPIKKQ